MERKARDRDNPKFHRNHFLIETMKKCKVNELRYLGLEENQRAKKEEMEAALDLMEGYSEEEKSWVKNRTMNARQLNIFTANARGNLTNNRVNIHEKRSKHKCWVCKNNSHDAKKCEYLAWSEMVQGNDESVLKSRGYFN